MSTVLNPDSIGNRIRRIRSARGLSQVKLADMCEMKKAQLSRYETDAATPRPEVAQRIAMALGVSLDWLLTGLGHVNPDEPELVGKEVTIGLTDETYAWIVNEAHRHGRTISEQFSYLVMEISKLSPEELKNLADLNK